MHHVYTTQLGQDTACPPQCSLIGGGGKKNGDESICCNARCGIKYI
jgi:hypothetical protein